MDVRPIPMLVLLAGCGSEMMFANQVQVDTFLQSPNDEVDILFVVDDSHSMAEEQAALVGAFGDFIGEVDDANSKFHLGVISTSQDSDDPLRGRLLGDPPYLTKDDDYVRLFGDRVRVGVEGSDKEQGLLGAALAVSPDLRSGANAGFLRDAAHLLVVFVSDEEDCSHDGQLDGMDASTCYSERDALVPVDHLLDALWAAKGGDREMVSIGAIIGPGVEGACDTAYPAWRYALAVHSAGGMIGDVCEPDWSTMLYDLGLTATGVLRSFELTFAALPDTLSVVVDGLEIEEDPVDGWTYDGAHTLVFHGDGVPARGAEIVVEYMVQPGSG